MLTRSLVNISWRSTSGNSSTILRLGKCFNKCLKRSFVKCLFRAIFARSLRIQTRAKIMWGSLRLGWLWDIAICPRQVFARVYCGLAAHMRNALDFHQHHRDKVMPFLRTRWQGWTALSKTESPRFTIYTADCQHTCPEPCHHVLFDHVVKFPERAHADQDVSKNVAAGAQGSPWHRKKHHYIRRTIPAIYNHRRDDVWLPYNLGIGCNGWVTSL